jgi:hypothetical protein
MKKYNNYRSRSRFLRFSKEQFLHHFIHDASGGVRTIWRAPADYFHHSTKSHDQTQRTHDANEHHHQLHRLRYVPSRPPSLAMMITIVCWLVGLSHCFVTVRRRLSHVVVLCKVCSHTMGIVDVDRTGVMSSYRVLHY